MTGTITEAEMAGHRYLCCEVCDGTDPHWTIMRRGDVVTSWACDGHLAMVCERLQRDFEVTELIVRDSRKAREQVAAATPAVTQPAHHYHDGQLCKCPWPDETSAALVRPGTGSED